MNFKLGDNSLVESFSLDQLKGYWHELKLARYDSHFYLKMLDKIKRLNPTLVMPPDEEIETIKNEALGLALWEENWEIRNRERVKKGHMDYSLFHPDNKIIDLNEKNDFTLMADQ